MNSKSKLIKKLEKLTKELQEAAEILTDSGAWMPVSKGGPTGLSTAQRKKADQIIKTWGDV